MTAIKASKIDRLATALLKGQNFTADQITSRFGLASPSSAISKIRYSGIPVFANSKTTAAGDVITVYRTGKAPRAVVAAGYKALALDLV